MVQDFCWMCECECLDPSGPHLCGKSHLNGAQTFQNLRLISTDLEAAPPTAVSPTLPEAVLGCLAGSYACVLDPVPDLQCLNIWHTLKHTGTRSLVSCSSDRHCTTLVCLFTAFLVMLPIGVIQLTSAFSRSVAESNISLYTSFWHVLLWCCLRMGALISVVELWPETLQEAVLFLQLEYCGC